MNIQHNYINRYQSMYVGIVEDESYQLVSHDHFGRGHILVILPINYFI